MRRTLVVAGVIALAGALAASVVAGTGVTAKRIVGSARGDVLKGSARADTVFGLAGNDTEYGYAGNDLLDGGKGNDKLVGGAGVDRFRCGPGKDTVVGDAHDVKPGIDCEVIKGIAASAPPPPPAAPAPHPGSYSGTTSQGMSVAFDVSSDGKSVSRFYFEWQCTTGTSGGTVILPGPLEVSNEGSFSANGEFEPDVTGSVEGTFDSVGKATGTLQVTLDATTIFGPVQCTSGTVSWTAT